MNFTDQLTMTSPSLKAEFDYYVANQAELAKRYLGKYIVIKNKKVIGAFDAEMDAVIETSKTEQIGSFLVQFCEPGADNYTQTFHSRVVFA